MSPSKTPKQARAMQAAAHDKSTLGIPKKVGQEFTRADKMSDKGVPENSPRDSRADKAAFKGSKAPVKKPFKSNMGKR